MPKLQALKSIFFSINGKTYQCIGTEGTTDPDDCIDTLKNMGTGQLYRVKLSHAMSQNVTWLPKEIGRKKILTFRYGAF